MRETLPGKTDGLRSPTVPRAVYAAWTGLITPCLHGRLETAGHLRGVRYGNARALHRPSLVVCKPTTMSTYDSAVEESDVSTPGLLAAENLTVADTGAGILVYAVEHEYRSHLGRETEIARRLIGFADVTDWDAITDAVTARSHGRGDALNLPEYDVDELPAAVTEAAH